VKPKHNRYNRSQIYCKFIKFCGRFVLKSQSYKLNKNHVIERKNVFYASKAFNFTVKYDTLFGKILSRQFFIQKFRSVEKSN